MIENERVIVINIFSKWFYSLSWGNFYLLVLILSPIALTSQTMFYGFLGLNSRCLRGKMEWESLWRGFGHDSIKDFTGGKIYFLNLRQSHMSWMIIQNNPFFEIITLKIFEDSCRISAQSLLLRLKTSDICSSDMAAAATSSCQLLFFITL